MTIYVESDGEVYEAVKDKIIADVASYYEVSNETALSIIMDSNIDEPVNLGSKGLCWLDKVR